MATTLSQPLYLVSDGGLLRSKGKLISTISEALHGADGLIGYVQLREQVATNPTITSNNATDEEVLDLCQQLREICASHQARLIVNRQIEPALRGHADGVHLGSVGLSLNKARATLGPNSAIGYSAHEIDEALAALGNGADYILFGPIFAPLSKRLERMPLGIDALSTLCRQTVGAVFAIGGISSANIKLCQDAGASGIASISSLLLSSSPSQEARRWAQLWRFGS